MIIGYFMILIVCLVLMFRLLHKIRRSQSKIPGWCGIGIALGKHDRI